MRKLLLFILIIVMTVQQGRTQKKFGFRSQEFGGISIGEMGTYGLVKTVNGVYTGPWFLGAGIGVDYYRFRSAPLFLSLNRDITPSNKRHVLFVDIDGGVNLPWY